MVAMDTMLLIMMLIELLGTMRITCLMWTDVCFGPLSVRNNAHYYASANFRTFILLKALTRAMCVMYDNFRVFTFTTVFVFFLSETEILKIDLLEICYYVFLVVNYRLVRQKIKPN